MVRLPSNTLRECGHHRSTAKCQVRTQAPQQMEPPFDHLGGAAEQRDEQLASVAHSITSSAMLSRDAGTVRPSILAVCTLMTNSRLVDCSTGRSVGLAPLRMR